MPRYFFDIHDGIEVTDNDGAEIADMPAVRLQAKKLAMDFAHGLKTEEDNDGGAVVVSVRDESGAVCMTVRLVMTVEGR